MNIDVESQLRTLRAARWRIERIADGRRHSLPPEIVRRYPWMPPEFREFVEQTNAVVSADEKAWLLTAVDFAGESDAAFAWNEWERQSLDGTDGDATLAEHIRLFWDEHLPILTSVKSGYAYFAIERTTLRVVCGEEPEYEQPSPLATSFAELLRLLAVRDAKLDRWI